MALTKVSAALITIVPLPGDNNASDYQILFTSNGSPSANPNFTWNNASQLLTVTGTATISTSAVIPIVNGGTAVSSTLTLQSTSGAGTSDAIVFKTASQSERMRITTAGNVGIGTASPGGKLDVVSTSDINVIKASGALTDIGINLNNTTAGGRNYTLFSSGTGSGVGVGNFNIYDQTSNVPRLSITSGGNILVNTISQPAATGGNTPRMTVKGSTRTHTVHGENKLLMLPAADNGAGTGDAGLYTWISEPGMTWTGAGIARNIYNTSNWPRVNSGLSGQMIRFDESTGFLFTSIASDGTTDKTYVNINGANNPGKFGVLGGATQATTLATARSLAVTSIQTLNTSGWLLTTFMSSDNPSMQVVDQSGTAAGTLRLMPFGGSVAVVGALSKGSGSFRIQHPLAAMSATHQLVHSFIEGPKCDLIYRGKVNLVNGKASVNIDTEATMTQGTFEALCGDVQCFTSNESGWGAIRGQVVGNILNIEAQDTASTDSVSWMVIGERKDRHILDTDWTDQQGRPIVEPLLTASQVDPINPESPNFQTI